MEALKRGTPRPAPENKLLEDGLHSSRNSSWHCGRGKVSQSQCQTETHTQRGKEEGGQEETVWALSIINNCLMWTRMPVGLSVTGPSCWCVDSDVFQLKNPRVFLSHPIMSAIQRGRGEKDGRVAH